MQFSIFPSIGIISLLSLDDRTLSYTLQLKWLLIAKWNRLGDPKSDTMSFSMDGEAKYIFSRVWRWSQDIALRSPSAEWSGFMRLIRHGGTRRARCRGTKWPQFLETLKQSSWSGHSPSRDDSAKDSSPVMEITYHGNYSLLEFHDRSYAWDLKNSSVKLQSPTVRW